MRMASYYFFLTLNFCAASFAMHSPIECLLKIIAGGDVDKTILECIFQKMPTMPGAKYEFIEQMIDETLLSITPDSHTYILYVIDYSKYEKSSESQDKIVPILRQAKEKFPKSTFPLNILLTKVDNSHANAAMGKIINYFMDKGVPLYLNNIFIVSDISDDIKKFSQKELHELRMLKNNMFQWSNSAS